MSIYKGCPCRFAAPAGVRLFTRQWYELHEAAHLAAFPDVDQRTRDNLRMLTETADR